MRHQLPAELACAAQPRLYALDITTGANKPNSPALVAATVNFPGQPALAACA
jgi:hypothetical protein